MTMPSTPPSQDITRLLHDVDAGREGAMDGLMAAVYEDLEHVARRHLSQRFGKGLAGITLEPAALVNESFLRLVRQRASFRNRGQFFAIATRVMLRVLVDYQRRRGTAKRGGDAGRIAVPLESVPAPRTEGVTIAVDALARALERLERLDPRKADVVKLRVVWGLAMSEIAQALDVSLATAERDWSFSKAWLAREAREDVPGGDRR